MGDLRFRPLLRRLATRPPGVGRTTPDLGAALDAALRSLPDRDRRVLSARFGLSPGSSPRTLAEVGSELSVTRERVRQVVARSLARVRGQLSAPHRARVVAAVRAAGGVASAQEVASRLGLPAAPWDPCGLARLALAACAPAVAPDRGDAWRLRSVPAGLVRRVQEQARRLLARSPEGVTVAAVAGVLTDSGVDRATLAACLRAAPDLAVDGQAVRWRDPARSLRTRSELVRAIFRGGRARA